MFCVPWLRRPDRVYPRHTGNLVPSTTAVQKILGEDTCCVIIRDACHRDPAVLESWTGQEEASLSTSTRWDGALGLERLLPKATLRSKCI